MLLVRGLEEGIILDRSHYNRCGGYGIMKVSDDQGTEGREVGQ